MLFLILCCFTTKIDNSFRRNQHNFFIEICVIMQYESTAMEFLHTQTQLNRFIVTHFIQMKATHFQLKRSIQIFQILLICPNETSLNAFDAQFFFAFHSRFMFPCTFSHGRLRYTEWQSFYDGHTKCQITLYCLVQVIDIILSLSLVHILRLAAITR